MVSAVFVLVASKSDKQGMNSLFLGSLFTTTISFPMDYKLQPSLTDTRDDTRAIRSSPVTIRKRRAFTGTTWKPRRLELHVQTLTIINVSNPRGLVCLSRLISVGPTSL
jgi:hypothetical protein